MSTILVTGGSGFIGSHVCEELLKKGHIVINLDNFNDYYDTKIKESNIQEALKHQNYKLNRVDITDIESLGNVFKENKIDKIIHLAARAGVRPSIKDPLLYEKVNVGGTLNLLELAKQNGINHFIFASSSSVYGNCKNTPFSEDMDVNAPVSPYAATKRAGELLCHTYHHLYGIKIVCLRFFTVYGPRGRPDMAPYLFTKLINEDKEINVFGNGTSKRDYTFISDIVKGIISTLDKELGYEIINLGNSNPIELNHFIKIIEELTGKKAKIRRSSPLLGDVQNTHADISKAREILSYSPLTNIKEGMESFIKWYLKNEK